MRLLIGTGLLNEYLKACKALRLMTGGSKCKFNKTNLTLKYFQKPYLLCVALGLVFGQGEIINFARQKLFGRNETNSYNKKYNTVALILACGKIIAYVACMAFLKYRVTQECFFNNLLRIEKTLPKGNRGNQTVT